MIDPCGVTDPITGAVCTLTMSHDVHKDESPDFTLTWVTTGQLVVVGAV